MRRIIINVKPRILAKTIRKAAKTFPAIVVTGPRQSGKTTLLKMLFPKTHDFESLEDPDKRMRAKEDPRGFLNGFDEPLIIDEIQYVPELLSYIKTKIDENRKPGRWFFTGSQNFVLMQGISQSLAGRAAVLSLPPFSYSEMIGSAEVAAPIEKISLSLRQNRLRKHLPDTANIILRGFFPEIASNPRVDRRLWCGSYISTYLERDVRNVLNIGDLNQFERFLKVCATRTGQILNISDIAKEIGISVPTARRWLSILEAGYQVYLLYPYYRNIGKRLVKSPKLYFCDTALATYLLGIHEKRTLINSPNFGALFETMVINDFLKRFYAFGSMPAMYYLRTRDGLEVDLLIETGQKIHMFEIKSSSTIMPNHMSPLLKARKVFGKTAGVSALISQSDDNQSLRNNIYNFRWDRLLGE